jgi:(2Fe-2S) ferredoxin
MPTAPKRIFLCTNKRPAGASCGRSADTHRAAHLLKRLLHRNGLRGEVELRKTTCLGRCQDGPILVLFPEKVWYTYRGDGDIEAIVVEHLVNGCPVARLTAGGSPAHRAPATSRASR